MATYFFIGNGCEVLACEAWEANARDRCAELKRSMALEADCISVYQCDPSELGMDSAGDAVWANPAEYAAAVAAGYDMPSIAEAIARDAQVN